MSASHAHRTGLMDRTVREVLGSLLAPELVDRVMDDALDIGGEAGVPEEADRARFFVEGPLRLAVEQVVGEEMAQVVLENLDPILEMAGSHVRSKASPYESLPAADEVLEGPYVAAERSGLRESMTPAAQQPQVVLVLAATLDRSGADGIARALFGQAEVRQVTDVFDLVSAFEAQAHNGPLLVIDCCLPAVEPTTVAAMLPVLPEHSRVVLWGATSAMRAEVEAVSAQAGGWLSCPAESTHDDVAALLIDVLRERFDAA